MTQELLDAVRLSVRDGDIVFVNAETIDLGPRLREDLSKLGKNFMLIPILVPQGTTVRDHLAVVSKESHECKTWQDEYVRHIEEYIQKETQQ